MKKQFFVTTLVLFAVLTMASSAFAAKTPSAAGLLTCPSTGADLEIGLSPQVVATYNYVAGAPAQWYAIATVHPGGTEAYGTAQDFSKTYKHPYTAGVTVAADLVATIPDIPASESVWGAGNWVN